MNQCYDLGTAHLANDNAIGAHTQRVLNQVALGNLALAL
jgi:hypothetical protein